MTRTTHIPSYATAKGERDAPCYPEPEHVAHHPADIRLSKMTIQPWENPVKSVLKQGRPVVAATVTANSVDSAAQLAAMGFDFLWIEMEHSPVTLETLRHIVLATRGAKAVPFARVPVNEIWTAKRVLDAGVHGVIFPFTSTPELAAQAAAATKG